MINQIPCIGKKIAIGLIILGITACGYSFRTGELLPTELRTMTFQSQDKYGDMARIMRKTLRQNAINIVENQSNVPAFYLDTTTRNDELTALFSTGKGAEKVIVFEATATVTLPNGERYPLSTRVTKTFFDNPKEPLAKNVEQEQILNEMRQQAAQQLIYRLFALKDRIKASNNQTLKTQEK